MYERNYGIIISVDDRNTTFIPSLFLSLSRLKPKKSTARARKTIGWEMGDAVLCSRRERKRPTNATDEEREEEKKVPQNNVFKLETTFTIYRANLDTIRICRESRYISFYSHFYLIS